MYNDPARRESGNFTSSRGRLLSRFLRFRLRSRRMLSTLNAVLFFLAAMGALACLSSLVVYFGFDHTAAEYRTLKRILRSVQFLFIVQILFSEIFRTGSALRLRSRMAHMCFEIPVLLTIIRLIYPRPEHPWLPMLDGLLYSPVFYSVALTAYSVVMLSLAVTYAFNRRTNPSLMLSISFLVLILIGSLLLSLPKCNNQPLSYVDALFISTSAVSITGLTPVNVATQFTPLGMLILGLLIQVGALGVMTFTCFFALFFSGNTNIYSQIILRDVIYTRSMSSLIPTLLYILTFTIIVELIGAAAIWWSVAGTMGLSDSEYVTFALFHSVSAFCNAGFSTIDGGMSNPALLIGNQSIYWITTVLIIAGAIGFPILVNFKDALFQQIKRLLRIGGKRGLQPAAVHIYNMNTKIVLTTFFILTATGALLFFGFEYGNSLRDMSLGEKITQSVFNSAVPRSAGFSSVNPAGFLNVTLLMVMFLMWVGGASQSTAGGVKVNTLAAICLNLKAIVTGAPKVTAFKRNIAIGSIRRANAVVALSIFSYLTVSMLLVWFEPAIDARSLLFESLSALFTVGSSLGATPLLNDKSLIVLSVAMFVGRVGIISLLTGLVPSSSATAVSYPNDNIIIS